MQMFSLMLIFWEISGCQEIVIFTSICLMCLFSWCILPFYSCKMNALPSGLTAETSKAILSFYEMRLNHWMELFTFNYWCLWPQQSPVDPRALRDLLSKQVSSSVHDTGYLLFIRPFTSLVYAAQYNVLKVSS